MGTVLGISADFHDAAAAVVVDGTVVTAAAEERFTRVKHDPSLPSRAVEWCLSAAGVTRGDLDLVVFYEKPLTVIERILATHARVGPRGLPQLTSAATAWISSKAWIGYRIERLLRGLSYRNPEVAYAEHHQSHAAAAFFPSPFTSAAIVTLDGVGEWATATIGRGEGNQIEPIAELRFPDSLGLMYSTITALCGFDVNDGEFKLMGLAPYGRPTFLDAMREHLVDMKSDGSIRLDQRYFGYRAGRSMYSRRLVEVFGPARSPDEPIGQRHADLARSMQALLEDAVLSIVSRAHRMTGERNLCLAGGVALNCVANGRVMREGPFADMWVQPAAGDDGSAAGAALWGWHIFLERPRVPNEHDGMQGAALGPAFTHDEIVHWLTAQHVRFREIRDDELLCDAVAAELASGGVVGWFRGAMEYGPRALGHRSILADPRDANMVQHVNRKVKGREGFRPFAPAVLEDEAPDWFDVADGRSLPYMLSTVNVTGAVPDPTDVELSSRSLADRLSSVRSPIPACTHVDGSARVQTVSQARSPAFYELLRAFHRRTGCPILLNTSFNRRDEPIVCTPADALGCAVAAGLDLLVLENCVIDRRGLHAVAGGIGS